MLKFLTEGATAVLVGIEAFMLGFGAIWMVMSAILTIHGWMVPALIAGAAASVAATLIMLRLARTSAANELKLVDVTDTENS